MKTFLHLWHVYVILQNVVSHYYLQFILQLTKSCKEREIDRHTGRKERRKKGGGWERGRLWMPAWVKDNYCWRPGAKVTSWKSLWSPGSTAVPRKFSNICGIKVHMVSISFIEVLFLVCVCTDFPYSKFLPGCAPSEYRKKKNRNKKKQWNGREPNEII